MSSNIVITMARQYGSGGKTIGAMLAKELGINCYSREILRMASEESGINERLFGMSDEKMKGAGWFKILSRPYDGELLPPEDKDFVSEENIFNYQAKIIKDLNQLRQGSEEGRPCGKRLLSVVHLIYHKCSSFHSFKVIKISVNVFPLSNTRSCLSTTFSGLLIFCLLSSFKYYIINALR